MINQATGPSLLGPSSSYDATQGEGQTTVTVTASGIREVEVRFRGRIDPGVTMDDVKFTPLPGAINIKPGSDPNSINLCSSGGTPVTIWGSEGFDVARIDPEQLMLASGAVKTVGKSGRSLCSIADVGAPDDAFFDQLNPTPDGHDDLTCQFLTQSLSDLNDSSTEAAVTVIGCDGPSGGCAVGDPGYFQTTVKDAVNIVKDCSN